MSTGSLLARLGARLIGALARYLAEPVSRPAATDDVVALAALLCRGDVLLTEGNSRVAALVRRLTRSPWAHVSIYVGPLEAGDDPCCIVEADISSGVRAVPLSEFKGQRARIVRPLGLDQSDCRRLADWLVGRIGLSLRPRACLGALPLPAEAAGAAHDGAGRQAFHLLKSPCAGVRLRWLPDRDEPGAIGRAARFRERFRLRSSDRAAGLTVDPLIPSLVHRQMRTEQRPFSDDLIRAGR